MPERALSGGRGKFAAVFGFESADDAARAANLIRKASSAKRSRQEEQRNATTKLRSTP